MKEPNKQIKLTLCCWKEQRVGVTAEYGVVDEGDRIDDTNCYMSRGRGGAFYAYADGTADVSRAPNEVS